jgi:hypothetical protein
MPPLARFLLLGGLALALLLPGQALASSIVFTKDDNVWLISPDGSRSRQVTTDGTASRAYGFPSQADDGTILAKYGDYFVRLRPDGTRIGAPVPALGSDSQHSGNVTVMAGPAGAQISPDGTRFAYWASVRAMVSCPIWDPGCSYQDTDYTIVSRVDRFTAPEEFKSVRDYRDPSWIDNGDLLVFNYGLGVLKGAVSPVGAGEPGLKQWFDPPGGFPQIGQGVMTRAGDKLATLAGGDAFGPAQDYVVLYGVTGAYPAPPEGKCLISDAVGPSRKFLAPTWSPDGTQLAVTESDGIHVFSGIPDLRTASPNCTGITERVLVTGAMPFWGPADVPAGGSQPGPRPGGGDGALPAAASSIRAARRQQGRVVRVRLTVRPGSTVKVRLLARKRVVGSAVRRNASGTLTVKVKVKRRLARRVKLSVRVQVTAPGSTPSSAVLPVVLRR